MTAMDSATRNAGDMIDNLTLTYNRPSGMHHQGIDHYLGAEALGISLQHADWRGAKSDGE